MTRRFFCFAHIPKTAGTTFHSIMERNFSDGYIQLTHDFAEGPIGAKSVELYVDQLKHHRAMGGHRVSLDLPFSMPSVDLRAIAFVREPLSWLRSGYHYLQHVENSAAFPTVQLETFQDYLRALAVGADPRFVNGQSRFLNRSFEEVEQLVRERKLFLFTAEHFDEACILLEAIFPGDFRDNSYVKMNVNDRKLKLEEKDNCDPEILEKVLGLDRRLYALAQAQQANLNDEIGKITDLERRTASFRRRCAIRRFTLHPLETFFHRAARFIAQRELRPSKSGLNVSQIAGLQR